MSNQRKSLLSKIDVIRFNSLLYYILLITFLICLYSIFFRNPIKSAFYSEIRANVISYIAGGESGNSNSNFSGLYAFDVHYSFNINGVEYQDDARIYRIAEKISHKPLTPIYNTIDIYYNQNNPEDSFFIDKNDLLFIRSLSFVYILLCLLVLIFFIINFKNENSKYETTQRMSKITSGDSEKNEKINYVFIFRVINLIIVISSILYLFYNTHRSFSTLIYIIYILLIVYWIIKVKTYIVKIKNYFHAYHIHNIVSILSVALIMISINIDIPKTSGELKLLSSMFSCIAVLIGWDYASDDESGNTFVSIFIEIGIEKLIKFLFSAILLLSLISFFAVLKLVEYNIIMEYMCSFSVLFSLLISNSVYIKHNRMLLY